MAKKTNYEKWKEEKLNDEKFKGRYLEEVLKYSIAEKIRNLREIKGITQQELAKRIHTSQSAIARIENTDYEGSSVTTLKQIADALGARLVIDFMPRKKNKSSKVILSTKLRHKNTISRIKKIS